MAHGPLPGAGESGPAVEEKYHTGRVLRMAIVAAPSPSLSSWRRLRPSAVGRGRSGRRMVVSGVVAGLQGILTKTDRPDAPRSHRARGCPRVGEAPEYGQSRAFPAAGRRLRASSS